MPLPNRRGDTAWQQVFWLADQTHVHPFEAGLRNEGIDMIHESESSIGDPVSWDQAETILQNVWPAWAWGPTKRSQWHALRSAGEPLGYSFARPVRQVEITEHGNLVVDTGDTAMRLQRDSSVGGLFWTDVSPGAELHDYQHPGDVGLDLAAWFPVEGSALLYPEVWYNIPTGIAVQLPPGYWGFIHGRSGTLSKGIVVHSGIIDNGFRGELLVRCRVTDQVTINHQDRLAQLILVPAVRATSLVHTVVLEDSARGTDGFGSTG